MHYLYAILAIALTGLTLTCLDDPGRAAMFAAGALLAAIAFRHRLPRLAVRLLAVVTVGMLFGYLGQFFNLAPGLSADWYSRQEMLESAGLLFAGFSMIPVLSGYSCRMKADAAPQAESSARRKPLQDILRVS